MAKDTDFDEFIDKLGEFSTVLYENISEVEQRDVAESL